MKRKQLISLISLLTAICLIVGCAAKEAANVGEESSAVEAPSTSQSATEDTVATEETGTTEDTEEPSESVQPERPPVEEKTENKYDAFVRDEITVNNSDYVIPDADKQGLIDAMNYSYYRYYDVAFYVLDLNTQMSFGYNATDYFSPGCTRKAGFALAWFKQAENTRIKKENGQAFYSGESTVTLDTQYYYDGTDYVPGAGYLIRHGFGWYTVDQLLYHMINESDNAAYMALWRLMGIERYKSLCIRLGIPEHPDEYRRDQLWTPMRPLDIGLIWQEIWKYKSSGSPEAEKMWYYFTHNEYNEIAKVVEGADVIAHKSGSDDYGFHDAGIVVRGDNAYVVVAMSTVPLSIANDDYDVIHMLFERIDPIMQDYYKWLEEQ